MSLSPRLFIMAATSEFSDWFNKTRGVDTPADVRKFVCQMECTIGFQDSTSTSSTVSGFYKIYPDSQSPRITFSMTKDHLSPTIVFGLQNCIINIDLEDEGTDGAKHVKRLREHYPLWFKGIKNRAVCIHIAYSTLVKTGQTKSVDDSTTQSWNTACDAFSESQSITIIAAWRENWTKATKLYVWILMLQEKIQSNRQAPEDGSNEVPTAFWHYYQTRKRLEESQPHENNDRKAYILGYPWLAPAAGNGQYEPLVPVASYYIDDHERRLRLEMAMEKEREEQRKVIESIFTFDRIHKATIRQADEDHVHLHVIINGLSEELSTVPVINEGTEVELLMADDCSLKTRGETVDIWTHADLVVEFKSSDIENPLLDSEIEVRLRIKANLKSIDNQIQAIKEASKELVFGDRSEGRGKGFSLLRTVLAHGSELNVGDPNYFLLDAAQMSPLEEHVVSQRLAVLGKSFQLDNTQQDAYMRSVRRIIAGVSLIQGPPGTGKTHVAVAIIVTLACLGLKVLLAAGSNKAVDNLSTSVAKFLKNHPELKQWCGTLARARTPSWQLSLLRADSVIRSVQDTAPTATTDADKILLEHQLPPLIVDYAKKNSHMKSLNTLLDKLQIDQKTGVKGVGPLKSFKHYYEIAVGSYLESEVSVLATTLSNSAHEDFKMFQPDFVICDESGQCLEGDHMIAMTRSTVKAVVLIGDPEQLPPTLISENSGNPEAKYVKRSLLERLQRSGYPCSILKTNYRCHPHILDMFNRITYKGQLQPAKTNSCAERVGNVWKSFAQEVPEFRKVSHRRRIFLNCDSEAVKPPKSSSLENRGQIKMALEFLNLLYHHQTINQERIVPSDIMLISPYKAHKKVVAQMAEENDVDFNENLTIDGSHGQEAEVVIYMLVRPSEDPRQVGFVANKARLNVALSRAKKLFIIIGNLNAWNQEQRQILKRNRPNKQLVEFLDDVEEKRDVVNWLSASGPRVSTMNSLTVKSKGSERPLSKRREKSPTDESTEMSAGDIEQAPKRQRVMSGSSASDTLKHLGVYKFKHKSIMTQMTTDLEFLESQGEGLRDNVLTVEEFRRQKLEIEKRVDKFRNELAQLNEGILPYFKVEKEAEDMDEDVEMEDQVMEHL